MYLHEITLGGIVGLTVVELPASIFYAHLNNYEEYIDLGSLWSVTLGWAHRVAKDGKTMINTTDLQEFLGIFEATMGFFSLTINNVKRYFFAYIANGLEPSDIKYLKKFLDADTPITTGMSITMLLLISLFYRKGDICNKTKVRRIT